MFDKFGVVDKMTLGKTTREVITRKIVFSDSITINNYLEGKPLLFASPNPSIVGYYIEDKHLYIILSYASLEDLMNWISGNNVNILLVHVKEIVDRCKVLVNTEVFENPNLEEVL
jgi:hypothetical protein